MFKLRRVAILPRHRCDTVEGCLMKKINIYKARKTTFEYVAKSFRRN